MTLRYFYDTEFLETGSGIDLISIGIVTEDGSREYYGETAPCRCWGRTDLESMPPHCCAARAARLASRKDTPA